MDGSLTVNGDLTANTITVGSTGRIAGNGTINGSSSLGGTVSPGASIGTLTFNGPVIFGSTSVTEIEYTGTPLTSDQIIVNDAVTIQDGAQLTFRQFDTTEVSEGTVNFLIASEGITGSFGDVRVVTLTDVITLQQSSPTTLTLVSTPADGATLISSSTFNPVNGSPLSLLPSMGSNDFWVGVDPLSPGDDEGVLGFATDVNFDIDFASQDGTDITRYSLPIRHTINLDDGHALILEAPISVATVEDLMSFAGQIGVGYRYPINEYWQLTPAVRVGGVYSDDFRSEAFGYGASLTSRVEFPYGDYRFTIGNHVGYYAARDTSLFISNPVVYESENVHIRNGLVVEGPLPLPSFDLDLPAQVFLVDNRNLGDDLFVDSYTDIGIVVGIQDLVGYPVRAGFAARMGDNTFGIRLSTGVRL